MKLIKYFLLIILITLLFVSSSIPFSIKCYKCWEKDKISSVANRSIPDETSGDKRIIYRCHYGHILYVDPESGERK